MHTLAKVVQLLCIRCAPLVHGPKSRRGDLLDPTWFNVLTTSRRSVTVARDISSVFFRLQSQTTNLALPFTVLLSGTNELPANSSRAIGVGTFSLGSSNFSYSVSFSGLAAKATGGHIHGGPRPRTTPPC
jgi:hypothetical protein